MIYHKPLTIMLEVEPAMPGIHTAHISVSSKFGEANESDILRVISSFRFSALSGLKFRSKRYPSSIFVENVEYSCVRKAPCIVLANNPNGGAWIKVTVNGNRWAQLAYQFGHELGHVVANSWGPDSAPAAPCQWIEEACVEAFSIRGLYKISQHWTAKAPCANWSSYSKFFGDYADNTLRKYRRLAAFLSIERPKCSFGILQKKLNEAKILRSHVKAVVPYVVDLFISEPSLIEDLGAMNLWQGRSSCDLDNYFYNWHDSCKQIGSPGRLPVKFEQLAAEIMARKKLENQSDFAKANPIVSIKERALESF